MTNNNPVKITETILRDAHQSLIATRMTIDEILPSLEMLDAVGYHALEAWGGATFDSCLRFLNEDPWERLRKIRDGVKNTKLQMLFRGQNILGYRHYSDDVVEYFVQKSLANGIDIIRIFDALNDPRNLDTAVKATIKEGGHVQAAFSYTISPVHNTQSFVDFAKNMEERGANSICIKDMAGLLTPYNAYELVKALKENVKIPIELHTHCTAGIAEMTYLKAIEAGVDIVDTALSPLSGGTSQPSTESIVATLDNCSRRTGLDLDKLNEARKYFMPLREKYLASGLLNTKVLAVDVNTLLYQVPGGMLSNLVSQLKQAGKEDKFEEVLQEVPRVREDAGFPPLVTPSSQIVGTQAVFNVLFGRYKNVSKEFKALVRGEYGKTPVPIKPEFVKQIIGDEKQITCRPADLIKPELDSLREEMREYYEQEEDVLSYALFDQVATKFFKARQSEKYGVDNTHSDKKDMVHPV
ncbi:MAG: oxaloacetate decarboxylase subunit alpha [Clostridia bacterium]|nr:oxaloacetate decarboxylase subunit alpha [Clostridia bacterium]MBO5298639.1 oxaloacetate decarboxylase subunit alpha [Clostridia bacterium]MBQ4628948.1 oxaloacetate decarboxylase subunit alpha [Clostridia bacterium]